MNIHLSSWDLEVHNEQNFMRSLDHISEKLVGILKEINYIIFLMMEFLIQNIKTNQPNSLVTNVN